MKNKSLSKFLLFLFILGVSISPLFFIPHPVLADEGYKFTVPEPPAEVNVTKTTTILGTINPIITWISGVLGIICVAYIVFAGIKIATSGENEENRKKAIKMITYAIIGLVIVLLAYAIVAVVASGLETI